jgi:photosystem II cytochrome c550
MFKRLILGIIATVFLVLQFQVGNASALEIDSKYRTVKVNEQGDTIVLSNQQWKRGEKLFYDTCSQCHNSGRTKTNPNVTLGGPDLAGAEPVRDNIAGLVAYLKDPTSYDGEEFIYELHPNTSRLDLFPEMRNYNEDDLEAVSGYILSMQKIKDSWGKGKVFD